MLLPGTWALATQPPDIVTSDGSGNTAAGTSALHYLTTGAYNTASGSWALYLNLIGARNTANGQQAFSGIGSQNSALGDLACGYETSTASDITAVGYYAFGGSQLGNTAIGSGANGYPPGASGYNEGGAQNTVIGYDTLQYNATASNNTAVGSYALLYLRSGLYNTAIGDGAISVSNGTGNTATGYRALWGNDNFNATGSYNTASGLYALGGGTGGQAGDHNTAFGVEALQTNTMGYGNAAQGFNALYSNEGGFRNLGIGSDALYNNVSGSYNIAIGYSAGYYATGNDNIYIANLGAGGESQILWLGTQGDAAGTVGSGITKTFVAGVAGQQVTGGAVYINSAGQLGVLASSERFKADVKFMADASGKLTRLRPVTFKLKTDADKTVQYGLIAEEVAKFYPELVVHGADGQVAGVRYDELAPMLLNETRRLQQEIEDLRQLDQTLKAAVAQMHADDMRVAMR